MILDRSNFVTSAGFTETTTSGTLTYNQTKVGKTCLKLAKTGADGWNTFGLTRSSGIPASVGHVIYYSALMVDTSTQYAIIGCANTTTLTKDDSFVHYYRDTNFAIRWPSGNETASLGAITNDLWYDHRLTFFDDTGTEKVQFAYKLDTEPTVWTDQGTPKPWFGADADSFWQANFYGSAPNLFYVSNYVHTNDGTFTPPTPTAGTATSTGQTTIDVTWTDVATATNADGISIERETVEIATRGIGVQSFSDSGLNAATEYDYRVRSYVVVDGVTTYGSYSAIMTETTDSAPGGGDGGGSASFLLFDS